MYMSACLSTHICVNAFVCVCEHDCLCVRSPERRSESKNKEGSHTHSSSMAKLVSDQKLMIGILFVRLNFTHARTLLLTHSLPPHISLSHARALSRVRCMREQSHMYTRTHTCSI